MHFGKILIGTMMMATAVMAALMQAPAVLPTRGAFAPKGAPNPGPRVETRCGWFVNPTPGNAWLIDREGEWLIGVQGGYQAEGEWPVFSDSQWVRTNVNYGHGCACIKAMLDKRLLKVIEIRSAKVRPLSACRKDKTLREPKP